MGHIVCRVVDDEFGDSGSVPGRLGLEEGLFEFLARLRFVGYDVSLEHFHDLI